MARRKRIGLIYSYNEGWIGGTYYIENLIAALGSLPNKRQPKLTIVAKRGDFQRLKQRVSYPHLARFSETRFMIVRRLVRKVVKVLCGRAILQHKRMRADFLFPAQYEERYTKIRGKLFWIPDLQEHFLPEMFSSEEIAGRRRHQEKLVARSSSIVFSGKVALEQFKTVYPLNTSKIFSLPFAVTLPRLSDNAESILERYRVGTRYFICCNQFWKHKNHVVLLRSAARLVDSDIRFCLTGNTTDYRNPEFFAEIQTIVKDLGIEHKVVFTGFIPREDQLILLKNSLGLVQPSLFEGWSTVLEDGKALGVPILASSIAVHREQLASYGSKEFFDPISVDELVVGMERLLVAGNQPRCGSNYDGAIRAYAERFLDILNEVPLDRV